MLKLYGVPQLLLKLASQPNYLSFHEPLTRKKQGKRIQVSTGFSFPLFLGQRPLTYFPFENFMQISFTDSYLDKNLNEDKLLRTNQQFSEWKFMNIQSVKIMKIL